MSTGNPTISQLNSDDIHSFVLQTESSIQSLEAEYTGINRCQHEWAMWLPAQNFPARSRVEIDLIPVDSEKLWGELFATRKEVEIAFQVTDEKVIQQLITDIKRKCTELGGCWYLALANGVTIGEIGVVPFAFRNLRIGRLQDVDILPKYQGRGFGNQLLAAICEQAMTAKLDGLCLMAKANDWPKDWYARFGFIKVGEHGN